jgi:Carboxypeptidase regulatory-like domain/TonB-dependent Receptor Plug Domain
MSGRLERPPRYPVRAVSKLTGIGMATRARVRPHRWTPAPTAAIERRHSCRVPACTRSALAVALLMVTAAAVAAQDTTGVGAIRGVVVNAAGEPAEGVRVCVLDTAACATSDGRGTYRIGELRASAYRLEILPLEGLPFASDPVDVRAGMEGIVDITLPRMENPQETVTVTAPAFRTPEAVKTSGFLTQPREILKSAAALQDVSRYVQGLPGVAIGTNDFRNDIIVRGGSPLENLFVVDNVEIPNINAFANFASAGGTVSLLDAELLQDVTFLTGGYPAPYINRTSSVLQVTQREGDRRRFGGKATLGFAGAGAILEGPINAGRGSWVVSARRSFLDLVTKDVGFGGVPVVYALNAKAVYDLTPRDRIWLVNISGVDEIRLGLTESTDLQDEIANFDIR